VAATVSATADAMRAATADATWEIIDELKD